MAGSYYELTNTKLLLDIASGDTADDSLLDALGAVANQHIDNLLNKQDERIPLSGSAVLEDIKMAANYYTASLYHARLSNRKLSEYWMNLYNQIIDGVVKDLSFGSVPFIANRFNGRSRTQDAFALWEID